MKENILPFKISTLVFVRDKDGKFLLIERRKAPNKGLWSPIGGKLEMSKGESPFECAMRETREEIGLKIQESDLHLFAMVSEKGYEGGCHWLMFLFDCKKRIESLPQEMSEGGFGLFSREDINTLPIPDTDRAFLWEYWDSFAKSGMLVSRAECNGKLEFKIEQEIQ